jgi:hypothetical protein
MAKFTSTSQPAKRGRPLGAKSKRLTAFKADGNKLLAKLMDRANEGDDTAAAMVLPFMPKPKAHQEPIKFKITGHSLLDKADSIISGVAEGEITPDVGCQLINSIGAMARIVELTELMTRIEMLEAQ